jgi:hypothetical protein
MIVTFPARETKPKTASKKKERKKERSGHSWKVRALIT